MLKSTLRIWKEYDDEAKKRCAEASKKTLEQLHREYLETLFTAAARRRFDLWDFAQKFFESDFARRLDSPAEMLSQDRELLFRDFTIDCAERGVTFEQSSGAGGAGAFRDLPPEGAWLAELYSRWHARSGEAACEIAERAPAELLRKIHKKAMTHPAGQIVELLMEHSADAAKIDSKDWHLLEESR